MKKAFLFLFLTIQMLGCKEDLVHEGKLSNEAETLNPTGMEPKNLEKQ